MTRYMQRTSLWAAILSAVVPALLLALAPLHPAFGQTSGDPAATKIRLAVSDVGFDCLEGCEAVHFGSSPWEYTVEVAQNTRVALSFVWNHQGYVAEKHVMVLTGYDLEWNQIDSQQREATLQFIADRPGTFTSKCDLQCELHDYMQSGNLKVTLSGGAAAAAYTPTVLTVSPSIWATGGKPVNLIASLTDESGAPVPGATVHFYLDAKFVGTKGRMAIGPAKTDANGVAFFEYRPTLDVLQHVITARFDGMGTYDASEQTLAIEALGVPPAAYTTAPVGLESLRHWAPYVLVAVVIGIWAVYGFVLLQVFGIYRNRKRRVGAGR